jgi:hypothetical protein
VQTAVVRIRLGSGGFRVKIAVMGKVRTALGTKQAVAPGSPHLDSWVAQSKKASCCFNQGGVEMKHQQQVWEQLQKFGTAVGRMPVVTDCLTN